MNNYREYLNASQNIRASLEKDYTLDQFLNRLSDSTQQFNGSMHRVVRLGILDGNPVAVRTFKLGVALSHMQADLEYCARKYAEHYGKKKVPRFAIGSFVGLVPYLFTEDLTENGKYTIDDMFGTPGSFLRPGGIEVLFDFGLEDLDTAEMEEITDGMLNQPLFFEPKNLLKIL